jgi:hypothetical protein
MTDRSPVMEWLRTWASDESATMQVAWRIPGRPITIFPEQAVDTPGERREVEQWIEDYNTRSYRLDDDLGTRMRAMAARKRRAHPVRTLITLPSARAFRMLSPPRDGYGLGTLPLTAMARRAWTVMDALLTFLGVASLPVLLWYQPTFWLPLSTFVFLRVAGGAALGVVEGRYSLEVLPVLLAALASSCALLWKARGGSRAAPAPAARRAGRSSEEAE